MPEAVYDYCSTIDHSPSASVQTDLLNPFFCARLNQGNSSIVVSIHAISKAESTVMNARMFSCLEC